MTEKFKQLPDLPVDPIMLANSRWLHFLAENPDALNTTVGVLVDPISRAPWQPGTVKYARAVANAAIVEGEKFGYQSQVGHEAFLSQASRMVLGRELQTGASHDILGYQALGGTGALWLAGDVIFEMTHGSESGRIPMVYDAGWPNHLAIFKNKFELTDYQHINPTTGEYDHEAALAAFGEAPENSVFLLQTCGYNDDGMDRTAEQWDDILEIAEEKDATVILDSAYMGLVSGFENERVPIDRCIERGLLTFVTFSASKNMGVYNERLGALFVANVTENLGVVQATHFKQLVSRCVRGSVSNTPLAVAEAASNVLGDPVYYQELAQARDRLNSNRSSFAEITRDYLPSAHKGRGLFAKLLKDGFSDAQVESLNSDGIFVLPNSRINIGGVHENQVERLGLAVVRALKI